jgi:hypothetical protein
MRVENAIAAPEKFGVATKWRQAFFARCKSLNLLRLYFL